LATVSEVPAEPLITRVANALKSEGSLAPPEWAPFVKTGQHKDNAPMRQDWWHVRAAAVLRKVYLLGPVGTERLAAEFGGKRDRGSAPYRAKKGSRSVTRKCLQQLEAAKLVGKREKRGRVITAKGRKLLDNNASEILKELAQTRKELEKYV
jgi:small subunit ribosomal protein S19e